MLHSVYFKSDDAPVVTCFSGKTQVWVIGDTVESRVYGSFRNSNFSKSPIHGCNFVGANLQGANLSGCRIWGGVSFKRANLTGVNWKDATFDKSVSWPEGFDPSKVGLKLVD